MARQVERVRRSGEKETLQQSITSHGVICFLLSPVMRRAIVPVLLLLMGCSNSSLPQPTPANFTPASIRQTTISSQTTSISQAAGSPTVLSIGDGDTLRVQAQGQTLTVRLACVDAPELNQPGGQAATTRLKQLLPTGQAIQLHVVDKDRYGRTVAEVYQGNESVNLRLVREGMVVVYRQYLSGCAETRNQYLEAEQQAQQQSIGFWSQANPVMPWDWRQQERNNPSPTSGSPAPIAPIPSAANSNSTSSFPACINQDCDCQDFQTQAEAQRVFEAFPGDPFRLDGDKDGRVCERLP